MHYLLIKTTVFVDPHGTPDDGGTEKEIVSGKKWDKVYEESKLPENKDKSYDGYEWIDEDDLSGSEDGYNSECTFHTLKLIKDEQVEEYTNIIKSYNQLK